MPSTAEILEKYFPDEFRKQAVFLTDYPPILNDLCLNIRRKFFWLAFVKTHPIYCHKGCRFILKTLLSACPIDPFYQEYHHALFATKGNKGQAATLVMTHGALNHRRALQHDSQIASHFLLTQNDESFHIRFLPFNQGSLRYHVDTTENLSDIYSYKTDIIKSQYEFYSLPSEFFWFLKRKKYKIGGELPILNFKAEDEVDIPYSAFKFEPCHKNWRKHK